VNGERRILVQDEAVDPATGWAFRWVDHARGVALVTRGSDRALVSVEGGPTAWTVTLRGRRIPVSVQGHRDRLLAESTELAAAGHGPAEVHATLPGLIVRVLVAPGSVVAAGDPLVTIEAMKMQNEIRAPRAGRVTEVLVAPGRPVAGGTLLVRLADLDP
jgi:biotin carboxyl carrier protein